MITLSLFLSPVSQQTITRPGQLDREARRLGRSLVQTGDEDEDDDDDDDDLMDMEISNIIFTPLLRSGYLTVCLSVCLPEFCRLIRSLTARVCVCSHCRPMSRNVVAATPRVQSFQVSSFIHPFLTGSMLQRQQAKLATSSSYSWRIWK